MLPLAVLINREVKAIQHDASVRDAARLMRDTRVGSLLVENQGQYVGIVSETDVVRRGVAEGLNIDQAPVHIVMSSPIITLDINRGAVEANALMSERAIRHLAITEEGRIIGILSVRDLLVYFKNQF
ncbi:MAG: CBS domain-containing protein [Nitrospirae bacterium]|nr:CBS domain-containing protein [Nitrospirota bacterium]